MEQHIISADCKLNAKFAVSSSLDCHLFLRLQECCLQLYSVSNQLRWFSSLLRPVAMTVCMIATSSVSNSIMKDRLS